MKTNELIDEIKSLRKELDAANREIETLRIRLKQSEILACKLTDLSRTLSAAAQHLLCFLDGTTRRTE